MPLQQSLPHNREVLKETFSESQAVTTFKQKVGMVLALAAHIQKVGMNLKARIG